MYTIRIINEIMTQKGMNMTFRCPSYYCCICLLRKVLLQNSQDISNLTRYSLTCLELEYNTKYCHWSLSKPMNPTATPMPVPFYYCPPTYA
jgi:hypothetical protein